MSKRGSTKITKSEISKMIDRKIDAKIETKNLLIADTHAGIDTTGIIDGMSGLLLGNTNGTRIGNVIDPISFKLTGEWLVQDDTNLIRTTVIQWFDDSDENNVTIGKIFEDILNERPLSPFNFNNVNRVFRVLFDRTSSLSIVGPDAKVININLFGRKLPKECHYNDAGVGGSSQIILILWTDSVLLGPTFKYQAQLNYKDA